MDVESDGWSNIHLSVHLYGTDIRGGPQLSPSIAEFTELGEYLDMPVRTYSTGMFVRLAFAISTSIQPDIIVMDELIGAGDAQFIEKAERRLKELLGSTKILVISSRSPSLITDLCNKAIWMEHGQVKGIGPSADTVAQYLASVSGAP